MRENLTLIALNKVEGFLGSESEFLTVCTVEVVCGLCHWDHTARKLVRGHMPGSAVCVSGALAPAGALVLHSGALLN